MKVYLRNYELRNTIKRPPGGFIIVVDYNYDYSLHLTVSIRNIFTCIIGRNYNEFEKETHYLKIKDKSDKYTGFNFKKINKILKK